LDRRGFTGAFIRIAAKIRLRKNETRFRQYFPKQRLMNVERRLISSFAHEKLQKENLFSGIETQRETKNGEQRNT
jgi:hypothetical protein